MELTAKQQAVELVKKAQSVFIFSHRNPDGDALGSLLALSLALQKMGKTVTPVITSPVPGYLKFLPSVDIVKDSLKAGNDFVIELDLATTGIEKLGYKKNEQRQKLSIVITPKDGTFSSEDVQFVSSGASADLVIVLDCASFDMLGDAYDNNTELFYDTPVVNIDHHATNEYFGKVNWVEMTATSTAEVVAGFIESLGREKNLMDADIATALLTGITTDTGSFQHPNTTPKSLTLAAQLVAAGARQQEIITEIYRTKTFSDLKIVGEILKNIHEETAEKFVWSEITLAKTVELGGKEGETGSAIDELRSVPGTDFALLLSERNGGVHGSFRASKNGVEVVGFAKLFGGGGHVQAAAFDVPNTTLAEKRDDIIHKVKTAQQQRLVQTTG